MHRYAHAFMILVIGILIMSCRTADWREDLSVTETQMGEIKTASQFGDQVYFGSQPEASDFPIIADARNTDRAEPAHRGRDGRAGL